MTELWASWKLMTFLTAKFMDERDRHVPRRTFGKCDWALREKTDFFLFIPIPVQFLDFTSIIFISLVQILFFSVWFFVFWPKQLWSIFSPLIEVSREKKKGNTWFGFLLIKSQKIALANVFFNRCELHVLIKGNRFFSAYRTLFFWRNERSSETNQLSRHHSSITWP